MLNYVVCIDFHVHALLLLMNYVLYDPLKGFLGLVMFEFEFLAGSDFLIVLVGESCPNMDIGGEGRCFSLKIMV